MVHAHHKHEDISKRGRDDDPLSSTLHVSPRLLRGGGHTTGVHRGVGTGVSPVGVGRISLLEDGDGLSLDDRFPVLSADRASNLLRVES